MPVGKITQTMPASSAKVFELLHDYSRRLEWDTLLCEAQLTRGHLKAGKGATSLCVGKPFFGLIGIETIYIAFAPGSLAAVKMINKPLFFECFTASIRHEDTAEGSKVTYKFHFLAKPAFMRWLMHPIMLMMLRHETNRRLKALATSDLL